MLVPVLMWSRLAWVGVQFASWKSEVFVGGSGFLLLLILQMLGQVLDV